MAKFKFTKSKKRRAALAALCAVTVTCTSLAAACQNNDGGTTDDETTRAEDTSTLTNGSFEFFSVPDKGVYLIKSVQDWSRSGDSSGTMSGILNTSSKAWETITDPGLADKLNDNNNLLTSDDAYVDYNGMKSTDIPYKEPYAARLNKILDDKGKPDSIVSKNDLTYAQFLGIKETDGAYKYGDKTVYFDEDTGDFYFDYDAESKEYSNPVRLDTIANPQTHYGSYSEKDGKHYLGNKEIYVDEDGNYYKDADHEYSEGNVLMIHNYPTDSKYNGIQQYYSSTTVNLDTRTAAKISVWVKTSDLKFDKGYSLLDEQDRGAFIEVVQTVGGTTIDEFTIKAINTEKILSDPANADAVAEYTSNGWLQYNIYVNACDFAQSTIQIRLGLGKPNGETCTGYAFFDDVTVETASDIEKTGYNQEIANDIEKNDTARNLASEGEDKIFYADKAVRGDSDARHSTHFNYYIDLASESGSDGYATLELTGNVKAGLTTEKEDKTYYASAEKFDGSVHGLAELSDTYEIYKNATARPTDKDLLGLFTADESIESTHIKALNDALFGDNSFEHLPTYDKDAKSKMLVMYSAWGAAYTSTIGNKDIFTLAPGEQMIVSFWVKTADMDGKTAATIYIRDEKDTDRKNANVQELSIDTTGIKTEIDGNDDAYNGWVQCFFFVKNDTKDGDKTFEIDFCFGNTSIISANSYHSGWIALANVQTLKISDQVYTLTATGNYTKKFQFGTEDKEKQNNKFAEALGTYDITEEIALPNGYNGVNGGSSAVSDADYHQNFDVWNTNHVAGLINRDTFNDETNKNYNWNSILKSFSSSAAEWNDVFGKDCYQPLIIVNNLRKYADKAEANDKNYTDYYILVDKDDLDESVTYIQDNAGRYYRQATSDDEFKEDETYYSFREVVNYGFVGSDKTISSGATEVISVKVMVTGNATAYVYLVDPATREIMGYSAPGYTFWYDDEGNVLDEEFDKDWDRTERDSHTVYDKQKNGLYKDKDGNFVANLHNLKKIYQKEKLAVYYYREDNKPDGAIKKYTGTKCVEGIDYYTDEQATVPAPHRLCNSDDQPIYEFKGKNSKGVYEYYYIVSGKVSKTVVTAFDTKYARYDLTGSALDDTKYFVEVPNTCDTTGKPQWVTVNFVIKAGNNSKSYRLELWSGKRGETGADDKTTEESVNGAVAFDYSTYKVSDYDALLRTDTDSYEKTIIRAYQELLAGHEEEFELDATIKDYEELAEKFLGKDNADFKKLKNSYIAHYYTYSLYDCDKFIPFNEEVAEDGETDYDYTAPDSESLAFFSNTTEANGKVTSYNMFIDYSAVEQAINKTNAPTDNSPSDTNDTDNNAGNFWLQLASILLVVVLLFVLLVLVARIIIKKVRRKIDVKKQSKNVYRQRKRYLRKLHIEEEETEEIDNPALQNSEVTEAPVEETPAEETPVEETPAEETPAETPAETTETPSENSEDKPE